MTSIITEKQINKEDSDVVKNPFFAMLDMKKLCRSVSDAKSYVFPLTTILNLLSFLGSDFG